MKREDMTVGMEVEHRITSDEPWEPGLICATFPGTSLVLIAVADDKGVYRVDNNVRPCTAASKKPPES